MGTLGVVLYSHSSVIFMACAGTTLPIEQKSTLASQPAWALWREEKSLAPDKNPTAVPWSCGS